MVRFMQQIYTLKMGLGTLIQFIRPDFRLKRVKIICRIRQFLKLTKELLTGHAMCHYSFPNCIANLDKQSRQF